MARSKSEPVFWSLFAAGGMVAALFYPAHILVTGIFVPEQTAWESLHSLFSNILFRFYLCALIALPMFHWAHRFRFALIDLGLKPFSGLLAVLFYGSALVGTVFTVATVF